VLLLPPSSGKAPGGDGPPWADGPQAFPALNRRRVRVRNAVRRALRAAPDGGERLLGARGPTLERSRAEWKELDRAPTLPAWRRYSGVVWEALSPATLSPAGATGLRERVLVPSGLWGLLAATDPVPPYRLKMGARVEPLGTLSRFWRDPVTAALAERAGDGWIVDLLPGEHAAAIDPCALRGARLVRVELVTGAAGDTRRAAGHAGKHAKGLLARAILETGARAPDEVAALEVPGLRTVEVRAEAPHHVVVMELT
jgi:cytoplasmic iron level regulating protein YaaA (DUF328/UPF0246 family)